MPEPRRRSRTLVAVLVLISLILITIDYRQGEGGPVSAIQRGALTVFGPVAEGFGAVVRPVTNFFGAIGDIGSLRDQNAELQESIKALQAEALDRAGLEAENERLRGMLDMGKRLGFTTTGAQVIAQPSNAVDRSVLLNIGSDNGLAKGMAVINELGLVGKLVQVGSGTARVELLTNPGAGYGVRIAETGEIGFLTGSGADPFQLELYDPEEEVEAGAPVVTHLFTDSTIMDGIPVGEVVGRQAPDSRFLEVRPYVDFTRLTTVQVVLDVPPTPEKLPSEDQAAGSKGPGPTATEEPGDEG
jgi:rod shape-determining protein MreC